MISVIVPVYNVENYLSKCIESLIEQTYKNLEIILVDDGSTDESGDICDKYMFKDTRIKVFHKKNGGLSDARNYGIERASGDYIAFLDSDDWVDSTLYENLYRLIKKYEADISICNFKKSFDSNEILNKSGNEYIFSNEEALNEIYTERYVQMILAWNKLYKRSILIEEKYPIGKIHEDEFLTPKLLYKAKRIIYIDKELIYYRQTPNSIMNSSFNINKLDYIEALEKRRIFFMKSASKDLYKKAINFQAKKIIEFYYKVNKSNIENKIYIMKNLKKMLIRIYLYNDLTKENRIKIKLFIFSPYLYRVTSFLYAKNIL